MNQFIDWPLHHLLLGHKGRVNCLVYPHGAHPRYDAAYLVSGGRDFSVILWDIVKCDLLHRFCVQAGEINQILVPPNECSVSVCVLELGSNCITVNNCYYCFFSSLGFNKQFAV